MSVSESVIVVISAVVKHLSGIREAPGLNHGQGQAILKCVLPEFRQSNAATAS
jgi:hypothetical protein